MKSCLALVAVVIACGLRAAIADAPRPEVTLRTVTPVVDVPTHRPGRQFLDLPALEYTFDVEARCDDDWVPESLSLNVADSRVVIDSGSLSGAEPPRVVLKVPARQLAPVAIHGFCLPDEDESPAADEGAAPPAPASLSSPLTIRAVVSAQASLLCRNEEQRRITYVSQPLDVQLACTAPGATASGL